MIPLYYTGSSGYCEVTLKLNIVNITGNESKKIKKYRMLASPLYIKKKGEGIKNKGHNGV